MSLSRTCYHWLSLKKSIKGHFHPLTPEIYFGPNLGPKHMSKNGPKCEEVQKFDSNLESLATIYQMSDTCPWTPKSPNDHPKLSYHGLVWWPFQAPCLKKMLFFKGNFITKWAITVLLQVWWKKSCFTKKLHNLVLEMLFIKTFHPKLTGREIFTLEVCSILTFLGVVFSTKTVFYSL